jgi:hypothetical protein
MMYHSGRKKFAPTMKKSTKLVLIRSMQGNWLKVEGIYLGKCIWITQTVWRVGNNKHPSRYEIVELMKKLVE